LQTTRVTLSSALNALEEQNVLYRKVGSGIFVSPKLFRRCICILCDSGILQSATSPFWGMLWGSFADEAQRRAEQQDEYHSFHLIIHRGEAFLPEDVMTMIQSNRVHGVLAISVNWDALQWIAKHDIPYVTFACPSPWGVELDSIELLRLGVKHLAMQGCWSIGVWHPATSQLDHCDFIGKHLSYFLADHGLVYHPSLVRVAPPHFLSLSIQEQGYILAWETFSQTETLRPDGVIIMDDMMTDGALGAFLSLGIKLGETIKIAAHSNTGSMLSLSYQPGVTVIEYDPADIVRNMFAVLDKLLNNEVPDRRLTSVMPHIRPPHRMPTL
jgi:DNA-binding LacI/PurR family transcriptional regulator